MYDVFKVSFCFTWLFYVSLTLIKRLNIRVSHKVSWSVKVKVGILETSKIPTVFQKRSATFHDIKNIVYNLDKWATTRAFKQCDIMTSVDSDEHVQPPLSLETQNDVFSVA